MKNPKLPFRKEAKIFGKEVALSNSRAEIFDNCPAYFAYTYNLFAHRGKLVKFIWFVYGSIIHTVAEVVRKAVLIDGTVSKYLSGSKLDAKINQWQRMVKVAIDPEEAYKQGAEPQEILWLPEETIFRMGPEGYQKRVDEKRDALLKKSRDTIRAVYYSTRIKTTYTFNKYEWRFSNSRNPDQQIRIPNLHDQSKPIWLLGALDDINYQLEGLTGSWYTISDLKSGDKKNLKLVGNPQMLDYNYVGRNIDHTLPMGKDGPRLPHLAVFNGTPPREQYLVSLDVEPWAFKKHNERVLYSDDFRLMAEVNFDAEWDERNRYLSDSWRVQDSMLNKYDLNGNFLAEDFEPLSLRGRQSDITRSIREGRFVPRISPRCGLCPAKAWCQEDHPVDWAEYTERHNLGLDDDHFIAEPIEESAEEELPPQETLPVQPMLPLSGRNGSKHGAFISSTVPKPTLKGMQKLGFMRLPSISSVLRKAIRALPLLAGERPCQCQKFKDLTLPQLIQHTLVFMREIEENELLFEAEQAKRRFKLRSKPVILPNPQTMHQFMLTHCPREDCLRRKEHEQKQEIAKQD